MHSGRQYVANSAQLEGLPKRWCLQPHLPSLQPYMYLAGRSSSSSGLPSDEACNLSLQPYVSLRPEQQLEWPPKRWTEWTLWQRKQCARHG